MYETSTKSSVAHSSNMSTRNYPNSLWNIFRHSFQLDTPVCMALKMSILIIHDFGGGGGTA